MRAVRSNTLRQLTALRGGRQEPVADVLQQTSDCHRTLPPRGKTCETIDFTIFFALA